ncbi:hypothetical protein CSE45_1217 [Citreicella sp. SE45]|nr:hypothetical protein CSE45_1217 [Citreicella sp. SE45]
MALLEQQQPHLVQHVRPRHRLARVLSGAHQHEFLVEKRHLLERGFRDRQGDDGGVEPGVEQVADQGAGDRLARAQIEPRVAVGQRGDDGGQQVGRDGGDDPDPQPPRQRPLRGAGEIAEVVDGAQDLARAGGEILAKRGQPDLPGAAFHQRSADDVLEFPDLHRQRRLADRADLGGAAEVADPGEGLEIAEVFHRQRYHKFCLSDV